MAGILAIEADRSRQMLLRALFRVHVQVQVTMVDSVKAAIASFSKHLPDLIIVPTLLTPADSAELAAHVKTEAGPHVQMVTISALDVLRESMPEAKRRTGLFRRQPISLGLQYDPSLRFEEPCTRLPPSRSPCPMIRTGGVRTVRRSRVPGCGPFECRGALTSN